MYSIIRGRVFRTSPQLKIYGVKSNVLLSPTRFTSLSTTQKVSRSLLFRNCVRMFNTSKLRGQSVSTPSSQSSKFSSWFFGPIGPRTVHFWAPVMKWALVLAGISDITRPVESLSLSQNLALLATGAIWCRWCFVIKPKNMLLAAVNFFLFCVGAIQVGRIFVHERKKKSVEN